MTALWWQAGVIYQIYPRSFQDTDDDGIGDLKGIVRRLEYLVSLGVAAIWISPIYPSPMVDFGYDVADYCDVDSRFGTLADFDDLLTQAHRRGLKVLLDFVPNHTSDQHAWFVESRSSQEKTEKRLVHLARSRRRRRTTQQLDQRFRRLGLGMGQGNRTILLPRLSEGAARP
jgi:alpha-glucosidase